VPTSSWSLGAELIFLLGQRGGGRRGCGATEELVAWANRAVDADLEGASLAALAGQTAPLYPSEVDALFNAVLDELDLPEPAGHDELFDAELLVVCDGIVREESDVNTALQHASRVTIDAGFPRRYRQWMNLAEDVAIIAHGDRAAFTESLTSATVEDHIRRLARETLRALPSPPWLPPYLALGRTGSTE